MSRQEEQEKQRKIEALLSDYVYSVQLISEHIIKMHQKLDSIEKQIMDLKVIRMPRKPKL